MINRRHVEHVTLIQSRRCRISTTLLRSANPNSFRTDWILCLHDSLVTMLFLSISLSGIGSLELRAVVSRVSLQHCLSKSLGALRRCLYCMAFHMQITSTLLISVPVTTWLGTGLTVLCIIPLHGSHCSSLIFGVRTWSLAVLRSLGSSCTPFIMLHFCHDFLCTLCCDSSLCSSSKSRRILDNLKSPHSYRFPHLHGYRHCVNQELLGCTGSGCSPPPSAMGYLAAGTSSPSRCAPGVFFHGAPKTAFNLSQTHSSGSVFRLTAATLTTPVAVPMYICLVGSQPQSEMHSIEELRLQLCSLCLVS